MSDVIQLETQSSMWREGTLTKASVVKVGDFLGGFYLNPGETG